MARPTKYKAEYAEQARKLCLLGAIDRELADFFDVPESTLNLWKKANPEFMESIKKGKDIADANVGDSLYQRATGYQHEDTHVSNYQGDITLTKLTKHYPPDPTSMIFWLKNRRKKEWRDKINHEVSGEDGQPIVTIIRGDDSKL